MKQVWNFISALYIWLVGGSVFFIATLFGIILFNIFPAKKLHYPYSRFLRLVFILSLIPVKRFMPESFDHSKSYIFMANHTSLIDVPLMGAWLPVFVNALEAHSHFKWPIYRHLIKAYGQIPVDRSSVQKSLKSFRAAAEKVNSGTSIVVFPEGHRTRDGKLRSFKKLPFSMAKQTQAPIVPVGIRGMWTVCGGESFFLKHGTIEMHFGNAISPETVQKLSEDELAALVREKIAGLSAAS